MYRVTLSSFLSLVHGAVLDTLDSIIHPLAHLFSHLLTYFFYSLTLCHTLLITHLFTDLLIFSLLSLTPWLCQSFTHLWLTHLQIHFITHFFTDLLTYSVSQSVSQSHDILLFTRIRLCGLMPKYFFWKIYRDLCYYWK